MIRMRSASACAATAFILVLIMLTTVLAPTRALAYSDEYATPKTWLQGYRANYFLFGNPDSKISLSAKTQLFEEHRLYFAYSQVAFWNIGATSSPMSNVDFNPELFYRFELQKTSWIDLGLLEHESNGQAGAGSRSWNRSYIRYEVQSTPDSQAPVYASLKIWLPYTSSFDQNNSDLLEYRGLYEVNVTVAQFLGADFPRNDLTLRFYPGGPSHVDFLRGGQELTFRFAHYSSTQFVPLWTLQLFNGYGEGLLDYKTRRTIFRIGLSF